MDDRLTPADMVVDLLLGRSAPKQGYKKKKNFEGLWSLNLFLSVTAALFITTAELLRPKLGASVKNLRRFIYTPGPICSVRT